MLVHTFSWSQLDSLNFRGLLLRANLQRLWKRLHEHPNENEAPSVDGSLPWHAHCFLKKNNTIVAHMQIPTNTYNSLLNSWKCHSPFIRSALPSSRCSMFIQCGSELSVQRVSLFSWYAVPKDNGYCDEGEITRMTRSLSNHTKNLFFRIFTTQYLQRRWMLLAREWKHNTLQASSVSINMKHQRKTGSIITLYVPILQWDIHHDSFLLFHFDQPWKKTLVIKHVTTNGE
jgi:hypothetical protein